MKQGPEAWKTLLDHQFFSAGAGAKTGLAVRFTGYEH